MNGLIRKRSPYTLSPSRRWVGHCFWNRCSPTNSWKFKHRPWLTSTGSKISCFNRHRNSQFVIQQNMQVLISHYNTNRCSSTAAESFNDDYLADTIRMEDQLLPSELQVEVCSKKTLLPTWPWSCVKLAWQQTLIRWYRSRDWQNVTSLAEYECSKRHHQLRSSLSRLDKLVWTGSAT